MPGLQRHRFWLIAIAAAAVIAVVIVLFFPHPDDDLDGLPADGARSASGEATGAGPAGADSADLADRGFEEPADNTSEENASERTPLHAKVVPFRGRVTDAETNLPITSFTLLLQKVSRRSLDEIIHERVEDEDGCFGFTVEPWGDYRLTIHSLNHCPYEGRTLKVPAETGRDDVQIALDPGYRIAGRVVDDETGRPLPGAVAGSLRFNDLGDILPSGFPEGSNYAETDAEGRFSVGGVKPDDRWGMPDHVIVGASHPDYAVTTEWVNPIECGPIEFRLEKGFCAFGRVHDDADQPIAGICVFLNEGMTIIRRPAYTDGKGLYRTGPARPGTVTLRACDLEYRYGQPKRFTSEEKQAEIVDRDVEVDFGPLPSHLTWSGTLIGLDGEPLADTSIELKRAKAPEQGPGAKTLGRARTDSEGRFEFHKIFPGEFSASVYLSSERRFAPAGDHEFETPGRVEKDIRLTCVGGTVSGVVIDSATGLPINTLSPLWGNPVYAYPWDENMRQKSAQVSEADGAFYFESLPAGVYTIIFPFAERIREVKVEDGSRIDGLELIIRPTGELRLTLEGFSAGEIETLRVDACARSGQDRNIIWPNRRGPLRLTQRLYVGDYVLRYGIEGIGEGNEQFVISAGRTTDVTIRRASMLARALQLEVRGRVTLPGGEPAAGAELTFVHTRQPSRQRVSRRTTCDAEGAYVFADLCSGLWQVSCGAAQGMVIRWGDVVIPPGATSPYTLDLAAPAGCVSGTLIDRTTGGIVDTGDVEWTVRVWRSGGGPNPADVRRAGKGNFLLQGIPGGRFSLSVWAPGYKHYLSDVFEFPAGSTVDMGNITLTPAGYLDLEIVERSGMPVKHARIYCDGKHLRRIVEDNRQLAPNRWLFFDLPTGEVLIRVEPTGCDPAEKEVILHPGERTRLLIEVDKRKE